MSLQCLLYSLSSIKFPNYSFLLKNVSTISSKFDMEIFRKNVCESNTIFKKSNF